MSKSTTGFPPVQTSGNCQIHESSNDTGMQSCKTRCNLVGNLFGIVDGPRWPSNMARLCSIVLAGRLTCMSPDAGNLVFGLDGLVLASTGSVLACHLVM